MSNTILLKFTFLVAICLLSCGETNQNPTQNQSPTSDSATLQESNASEVARTTSYDLSKAAMNCTLVDELREISALSYYAEKDLLLAVNDEKGILFLLDTKDCAIQKKIEFGKKGDYEGVELAGDTVYVVKSNGNVVLIDLKLERIAGTLKNRLSVDNDIEGLAYDKSRNELILACKGKPSLKGQKARKRTKAFYRFNLERKELIKEPAFVITDDDLKAHYTSRNQEATDRSKKIKRLKSFSPSAIAQHPIDGYYYILSSVGRLMVTADGNGKVIAVDFLNPKNFSQPEGICFTPDGTLYISNEGRDASARILRFDYQ